MTEPDASIVILQKLHLHPEEVDVVDGLEIEADFVAGLEAVHFRIAAHELRFISRITELPVVELNLAIIGMFHLLRGRPYHGIEVTVVRSLGVIVCRLLPPLLWVDLEARRIEGEGVLLAEATQAVDL